MTDVSLVELLFFDTFSHESSEELNLDLVQFPKPVIVTEVRIIPLGAKVQADFPGGVRLGATNPSQFNIEFFVNDLGKPGASTFETLGGFEYSQNGKIHLECIPSNDIRQIPTDGLVLRGWYTTITLAVYGSLTKNVSETVIPAPVSVSQSSVAPVTQIHAHQPETNQQQQNITPIQNTEWQQEMPPLVQIDSYNESTGNTSDIYNTPGYGENYEPQAYAHNYYEQKDPRNFQQPIPSETEQTNWPPAAGNRDKNVPNVTQIPEQRDIEVTRTRRRSNSAERNRERRHSRGYSRSSSRDRDYKKRDYRSRSPSSEYRSSGYPHKRDLRSRDSSYDKNRSYERPRDNSYDREDVRGKRPRTPPMERPRTPKEVRNTQDIKLSPVDSLQSDEDKEHDPTSNKYRKQKIHQIETIEKSLQAEVGVVLDDSKKVERIKVISPRTINENNPGTPLESPVEEGGLSVDEEQFEPILSDEDIADENDSQFADDYDYMEYTNNDDLVKLFNPFNMELMKYKKELDEVPVENLVALCDLLKENKSISSVDSFKKLTPDLKEAWIEISEQVPSLLTGLTCRNILTIDRMILEVLLSWLEIGVNFELALSQQQPGFKIRHIKCGVRICEVLCMHYEVLKMLLDKKINIFKCLLDLYSKDYMSLSIKLMVFKALDMLLSNTKAVEFFVETEEFTISTAGSVKTEYGNGYQVLISILQRNPLTRLKFAVKSLLKKLHIFEVLKKFRQTVLLWCKASDSSSKMEENEILESEIELVTQCLSDIKDVYVKMLSLAQPRRFLPVNSQFDTADEVYDRTALHEFFTAHSLLECVSLILNHPAAANISALVSPILDLLTVICKNHDGLLYLSENLAIVNLIVRSLLQTHSEEEFMYTKSHNLGMELSYKIQTLYHMEYLTDIYKHNEEFIDQLHCLYCLCLNTAVSRIHVAEVLAMGNHIKILLNIFLAEKQESKDEGVNKLKSPAVGYAVDLLDIIMRNVADVSYLRKYGRKILEATRQHEFYEPSTASKLQEIAIYLSPLDKGNVFNYDDISGLCEFIKKSVDGTTSFPGDLITCLRVLKHLAISDKDGFLNKPDHIELKYKHVTLQLYSGDGIGTLVQILDKICGYFSQPGLHTPSLASNQGFLVCEIVLPACELLRKMLSYVIACRNTNFKDLTAVNVLLRIYNLMYSYTMNSTAWLTSRRIMEVVINILLVYTQPVSIEMTETNTVHKSVWSLLIAEILKFIMDTPCNFIPGLLALSEMLPLPLPLITKQFLSGEEINTILTSRRLWSAHLHCQQTLLTEMIQILCQSSYQPLLQVLRKVCLQIADLAPNMSLLVSKVLMDLFTDEVNQVLPCNQHTTRLLYFFACLISHGSIKISVLSCITTNFVNYLCTVLKTQNESSSHIQAQDFVLSIIQSMLDTEIKLMNYDGTNIDLFLANVLPNKEIFLILITGVFENIVHINTITCLPMVIRTFSLLAEHNYGFYYLKLNLLKKPLVVPVIFQRILDVFKTNTDALTALSALLEFLRFVTVSEDIGGCLPKRTSVVTNQELVTITNWADNDKEEHTIRLIQKLLQGSEEDTSVKPILETLTNLMALLQKGNANDTDLNEVVLIEPCSLPAEDKLNLVNQFAKRLIHIAVGAMGGAGAAGDLCEDKLSAAYWLSAPPACDEELELDQISTDLSELVRTLLPAETNIVADVKRLLHLGAEDEVGGAGGKPETDQLQQQIGSNNRPMFRTRKMDLEQNGGHNNKRMPFVSQMRGRGGYASRLHPMGGPMGHHTLGGGPQTTTMGHMGVVVDAFRSRPPNTSRPPSLHVDDFQALETRGAQPTGPTGYNRIPRDIMGRTAMPYRHSRGRVTSWPSPHHIAGAEYHPDTTQNFGLEHFGQSNNSTNTNNNTPGGGIGGHFVGGSGGATRGGGTGGSGNTRPHRGASHPHQQRPHVQRTFLR